MKTSINVNDFEELMKVAAIKERKLSFKTFTRLSAHLDRVTKKRDAQDRKLIDKIVNSLRTNKDFTMKD